MNEKGNFTIKGSDGYIKISVEEVFGFPNETCHWGGYDTKSIIEIIACNYRIKGQLYISTGEIYSFFQELKKCHQELSGRTNLESYERNLRIEVNFEKLGQVRICGNFQEYHHSSNDLTFEIESDQSYFNETITELTLFVNKYGDMTGILRK